MDNSKINQTELSYSCNAGEAKANLYTGRMVLEQNLSTIGMRHYEISLSQIYNSHLELPSRLNSRLGNKWKLSIQQYLYQENNNYYYIDATGMKIEFDLLTDNTYYDKEGLGLQLFKNGNLYTIKDPLDNEMIFQNERLIKTIIKEQTNITQKFEYDNTGKLIRFLNENKIDNKFEFNYNSDNLLNEILVYVKNNLKYKYKYIYDTNKNLLSIKKEQKGFEKIYLLNKYQDNQLIYSVYFEDKSAFKFSYSNNKIIEVKIGVATLSETNKSKIKRYVGDEIYVGEDVYLNDLIYDEDYTIEDCMNEYGVDVLKLNKIAYCDTYTEVTNEVDLKFIYYLNNQGFTTSILEANSINDLRTLERMPGIRMLNENINDNSISTLESINKQKALRINSSFKLSTSDDGLMDDKFSKLKEFREHTCSNYINYVCSFWLKLQDSFNNNRVKLTIKSGNKTEYSIVTFDKTAVNSWQEVRIPIKISNKVIKSITLEFLENDVTKYLKVADMKLYDSGLNNVIIGGTNSDIILNDITKIKYTDELNQQLEIIISDEYYITEKDLQMTYLSIFKNYINNNSNGLYSLYLNDCTHCFLVKNASLCDVNNNTVSFGLNNEEGVVDGFQLMKANYYLKSTSPDGDLNTYQTTSVSKNSNIDGNIYNCMFQMTEANLYDEDADLHKSSYSFNCIDFHGKTLLEQDEYGVRNIYKYNNLGDLIKKIITSKNNGSERIVENVSFENDIESVDDENVKFNSYYDNNENLYKTEYLGVNENNSDALINNYSYNYFDNKVKKVNNNLGGENYIKYDACGRINEISPKKISDANYYGYKFRYDKFGDPSKFLFTYKNNNEILEDKLITRDTFRSKDLTLVNTEYHRSNTQVDFVANFIDKYGRIEETRHNGLSVLFERENLDESNGAANISKMTDELNNDIHTYEYNDNNELIKYGFTNSNGSYMNVEKAENDKTKLKYKNSNIGTEHTIMSTIKKDEDVLMSPRVINTLQKYSTQTYDDLVSYEYDTIGRIIKKEQNFNTWYGLTSANIHVNKYNRQKTFEQSNNLIKNIVSNYNYFNGNIFNFNHSYKYNDKNNIKENNIVFSQEGQNVHKINNTYTYNKASQLISEVNQYINDSDSSKNKTKSIQYTYNNDGSLNTINKDGIIQTYNYNKGRLSSIRENNINLSLSYDNLGNTLTFGGNTYTYTRGNLLSSINNGNITTNYHYNGQGKKYKKELSNGKTITYLYDNEKLISEKHSTGEELTYLYDLEGIYGFRLSGATIPDIEHMYYFEKDVLGNVVSIINDNKIITHYEYDAFGNCNILYSTNDYVSNINPIRWKGMYCEVENNLYLLKNNTYSPELRQTLSMNYLDEIVNNSFSINNLYSYNIFSKNPISLTYDEYNIESGLELTYEPPQKSKLKRLWESLWNRWWGKVIAVALAVIALVVTLIFSRCAFMGFVYALVSVGATLVIGGLFAGRQSQKRGKGFWNGFANYINENWAQTLAVEMIMYIVSFGITKALQIGTKCFIEGTLVLTSIGLVKIEDIKVGDEVSSYNEETNKKELKKVKRIFRNKTNEWLHLTIKTKDKEEEIVCTKNHRIYINNKGWIEAKDILENDEVLLYNNVKGEVIKKELQILDHYETTYNFEVEDNHNYYVSDSCVLVHNDCKSNFEVLEFDERAISMAKEGNPSFQTFKNRLFKYQHTIDSSLFDEYIYGLNPSINGKKIILHHPKGRVGPNLYNVVGVTSQQHLNIHAKIGYRNAQWDDVIYYLGKGVF